MHLSLPLLENPPLNPEMWEHLDERHRAVVLDKRAHLIAKTAENDTRQADRRHE